jgi:hypothetical protein
MANLWRREISKFITTDKGQPFQMRKLQISTKFNFFLVWSPEILTEWHFHFVIWSELSGNKFNLCWEIQYIVPVSSPYMVAQNCFKKWSLPRGVLTYWDQWKMTYDWKSRGSATFPANVENIYRTNMSIYWNELERTGMASMLALASQTMCSGTHQAAWNDLSWQQYN